MADESDADLSVCARAMCEACGLDLTKAAGQQGGVTPWRARGDGGSESGPRIASAPHLRLETEMRAGATIPQPIATSDAARAIAAELPPAQVSPTTDPTTSPASSTASVPRTRPTR